MSKWFIRMPLVSVEEDRGSYGYDPYVPGWSKYHDDRAEIDEVGFLTFSSKNNKHKFVPGIPKRDYGYIVRVYVVGKAGYVTKRGYPEDSYVFVEEGTIFAGCDCNRTSYGIPMMKGKAEPFRSKNTSSR